MKRRFDGLVMGVLLGITIFISINVISYQEAYAIFEKEQADLQAVGISFSHTGFYWGFPFPWLYEGTCFPCHIDHLMWLFGALANLGIGLTVSLAFGLCIRLIVRKLQKNVSGWK